MITIYARFPEDLNGQPVYLNLDNGNRHLGRPAGHVAKCADCGGEMLVMSTGWLQCALCHEYEPLPGNIAMILANAPRLPGF